MCPKIKLYLFFKFVLSYHYIIHIVLLRIDYIDSTTVVQDILVPSGRDNNLKKHQCQRVFRSFRSEIHLTKCNLVQVRKNKVHKNKAAFHFWNWSKKDKERMSFLDTSISNQELPRCIRWSWLYISDQGQLHGFQFGRLALPNFQNLATTATTTKLRQKSLGVLPFLSPSKAPPPLHLIIAIPEQTPIGVTSCNAWVTQLAAKNLKEPLWICGLEIAFLKQH